MCFASHDPTKPNAPVMKTFFPGQKLEVASVIDYINNTKFKKALVEKMAVRMKIFHVCPNFYPVRGGIETFVYELSKELAGRGHDVTVITGNKIPGRKVKLASYSVKDVIKIHRFNFKKVARYNTSIDALKFIMGSEFDILHIHGIGFFSDAIPLIKASGYRKVVL